MTEAELAAIEARANAATAGPWFVFEDELVWQLFADRSAIVDPGDGSEPTRIALHPLQLIKAPKKSLIFAEYWLGAADSNFIAHARTDIPDLIAEVRRLRKVLEVFRDEGLMECRFCATNGDLFCEYCDDDAERHAPVPDAVEHDPEYPCGIAQAALAGTAQE